MGILGETPPPTDFSIGTRWSILVHPPQRQSPEWEASWTYLVDTYRPAMERYVRRVLARSRGGGGAVEAADVVQAFLAECVEKDWLLGADPTRGRFRAYLQTLLRRYAWRVLRDAGTEGRGGKATILPIQDGEALAPATPDEQADLDDFSRGWVEIAVDRTRERLSREHERYSVVLEDLIATDGKGSEDLPQRVGLDEEQIATLRHRVRKRFCELFEYELKDTVGDSEAFADEWRAIRPFLPRGF